MIGPMTERDAKVHVVGVGGDGLAGLTARSRELLAAAEGVFGADAALRLLPDLKAERVRIGADLHEVVERLRADLGRKRMAVVATGDPLFYGVARYLCDKLGKDRFEVVPHVSSMQLAFARIKESWDEAFLTNLANHPVEQVVERIRTATKVGLFTSDVSPPSAVAKALLDRRIDYFSAYVCENLGSPDERVTQGELSEI